MERLRLNYSRETAPDSDGAVFQVGAVFQSKPHEDVSWLNERQFTVPIFRTDRAATSSSEYLPVTVQLPHWASDEKSEQFQRLKGFASKVAIDTNTDATSDQQSSPFQLQATPESFASLLQQAFHDAANARAWFKNSLFARLVFESPTKLKQAISQANQTADSDGNMYLTDPDTGKMLPILESGMLMADRWSLIVCALLMDDSESGPEQLLRFIHKEPADEPEVHKPRSWQRKKNQKKPFLDDLIDKTTFQSELVKKATDEVSGNTEKKSNSESIKQLAAGMAISERALVMEVATKNGKLSNEGLMGLENQRTIINQMKYKVPKKKPDLEDQVQVEDKGKKKTTEADRLRQRVEWSVVFQEQIRADRALYHQTDQDPKPNDHLYTLLLYQLGEYPLEKIEAFKELAIQATHKPLQKLTHEEIAVILSTEMEMRTRPIKEGESLIFSTNELGILQVAEELHEYGLFYINAKLGDAHDPMALHMSGGVLCLAHTPIQIQMMSNIATQMQVATVGLQLPVSSPSGIFAFSSFAETLGSIGAIGQGIPIFAQALALGGVGMGAVFSGGERKANTQSSSSVTKPKNLETPREVPKPRVIFQSPRGGNDGEKKSAPPAKPKSKKRTQPTPPPKKTEKPKVTQASSSRSKFREVPIFTARRESRPKVTRPVIKEKKVAPPVAKEPKVKLVPRLVLQPHTASRSGNERRVHASSSRQHSRTKRAVATPQYQTRRQVISDVRALAPFSKRIEQTSQPRSSRRVIVAPVESKATITRSETSYTTHRTTKQRTQQRKVDTVQFQHRVQSQGEKTSKIVTASSRREVKVKPASTTQTKKEVRQSRVQAKASSVEQKKRQNRVTSPATSAKEKKVAPPVNTTTTTQPKTIEIRTPAKKTQRLSPDAEVKAQEIHAKARVRKPEQAKATETTIETIGENLLIVTAALVGGALFETAKRVIPSRTQDEVRLTVSTTESTGDLPASDTDTVVDTLLARRHAEYGQGRGGRSSAKKKTQAKVQINRASTQKTDRVLTATMRSLPTKAMIDVSDSFNTAREVKMWAQEAFAYPKLMERYYATAA